MGDSLAKLFVLILTAILLFFNPLLHMFEQQDQTSKLFVLTETTILVDSVRNIGFLSPDMYQEYVNQLSNTANHYEVKIEHHHKKYDPVYTDPLDDTTFKNAYNVNEDCYYTQDILAVLFPTIGTGSNYEFSSGDYFMIRVYNKNKTIATKMKQMFYGIDFPATNIYVQYGGMVK